jgi:hypothetical protein
LTNCRPPVENWKSAKLLTNNRRVLSVDAATKKAVVTTHPDSSISAKGIFMRNNLVSRVVRSGLAVVAVCLIGWAVPGVCHAASVEQEIEKMTVELNKTLPKQMDEITRLDRVVPGPGRSYAYHYTLSMSLTDAQKQLLQDTVRKQVLATAEMQPMLDAGVTIWYKYFDAAGKSVLEFSVNKPGVPAGGGGTSKKNIEDDIAYKVGFVIGIFIVIAVPIMIVLGIAAAIYFGMRRGRRK